MRENLPKVLKNARLIWLMLTIEILATSFLYAILMITGLSNQASTILACIAACVLISIDMLITHKYKKLPAKSYLIQQWNKLTEKKLIKNNKVIGEQGPSAQVAEILLSLFGIFGIGWLMVGETAIGVILLLGSIFIYWPVMLVGSVLTEGFGLIFLGPLAVVVIILNTVLLSYITHKKASHNLHVKIEQHLEKQTETSPQAQETTQTEISPRILEKQ